MRWIGASYARSSGHISARKSKSRSSRAKPRPDQDCEHDAADPARKILGKQTGGPPLNEADAAAISTCAISARCSILVDGQTGETIETAPGVCHRDCRMHRERTGLFHS